MARRSDHSREELYELALLAARGIVEKDGYRALTARNVADEIGYSAGTLYNLFANLDDLIVHVNARTLDDLRAQLAKQTGTGDPERDIAGLLDRYLEYLEAHPGLWQMLFEYARPEDQPLPDWYARKVQHVLGEVEAALAPLFHGDDDGAENAARVLWAGLHGITSLTHAGKMQIVSKQSTRELTHSLTTNFIAGLRVHNSEELE